MQYLYICQQPEHSDLFKGQGLGYPGGALWIELQQRVGGQPKWGKKPRDRGFKSVRTPCIALLSKSLQNPRNCQCGLIPSRKAILSTALALPIFLFVFLIKKNISHSSESPVTLSMGLITVFLDHYQILELILAIKTCHSSFMK